MKRLSNINCTSTYNLKREIARGGMGAVYEAEQVGVEGFVKTVAIKTILDKFTTDDEFTARFIGEAKLVANLVHPNIVQIYQLDRYDEGYFIAMEYIHGITADDFINIHSINRLRVPVDFATFITSRIARALEHAHTKCDRVGNSLEIVHRDICPKNIMITNEGEVKLTDFGIAKAAQFLQNKEGDLLLGKVQYMSPEQASMQQTDSRSDVFSLGIVFYELITGVNPFKHKIPFESLKLIREGNIADPRKLRPDIPDDVYKILMRALEKDCTKRYNDASEFCAALELQLYSDGFGPTIKKLADYMNEKFTLAELHPSANNFDPSHDDDLMIRLQETVALEKV